MSTTFKIPNGGAEAEIKVSQQGETVEIRYDGFSASIIKPGKKDEIVKDPAWVEHESHLSDLVKPVSPLRRFILHGDGDQANSVLVDYTHWPLLLQSYKGEVKMTPWAAHVHLTEQAFKRGERFCGLSFLSYRPDSAQRRLITNSVNQFRAELKQNMVGWAMTSKSGIVRAAVTAIEWVAPSPFPTKIEGNEEGAIKWLAQQARQAQLNVPAFSPLPRTTLNALVPDRRLNFAT